MTCKCKGTGRRDGFSEYLDCMEPGCNAAVERAEFNKRLKEAGSMSVEDAAWWGRQQGVDSPVVGLSRKRIAELMQCFTGINQRQNPEEYDELMMFAHALLQDRV